LFLLEMQEYENQWLLNEFEEKNLKWKERGNCKKNDLFYQSIRYPLRLLKNSSGCHLRWLACLKGPCFFRIPI
jgi:hypothetical protein